MDEEEEETHLKYRPIGDDLRTHGHDPFTLSPPCPPHTYLSQA